MTKQSSIILATSNGTGMGHLARQLAVGIAATPEARVTLFSMSAALPTATTKSIRGEYCPGPDRAWIPEVSWPQYLSGRLEALVEETSADVVVFDGVAPYRGITLAKSRLPETAFVWFRRGMWQSRVNDGQLWKSSLFDQIIEPGETAAEADRGPTALRTDALRVPPVSLVEVIQSLSRREAAAELGISADRPSLLLTLGTGRLGDVSSPGSIILDSALEHDDWQICVATSAVATTSVPTTDDNRVTEMIGVFPLAKYLSAFDAVVSAAGYNATHEYLAAGLPTLFVPNRLTRTDDQVSRARHLSASGLALLADNESPDELRDNVAMLLDSRKRASIREALRALPEERLTGGSRATAAALVNLAQSYRPTPATPKQRLMRLRDDAKERLKRRLGPRGVDQVRRLLGRSPMVSTGRLEVVIDAKPHRDGVRRLVFESTPTVGQLLGDDVVEHILAGSSTTYRARREMLVHHHYDVVSPH